MPTPDRPSHYQLRIIDFVRSGSGNGVVQATAGAGKTSSLIQVASTLPAGLKACFLAFGKDAAAELSQRLPAGVPAMTAHSLGRKTLQLALGQRGIPLKSVDRQKYRRLLRRTMDRIAPAGSSAVRNNISGNGTVGSSSWGDSTFEYEEYLLSLAQFARLNLTDIGNDEELDRLALRYDLILPESAASQRESYECVRKALAEGLQEVVQSGIVDFTDMLYAPVSIELPPPRFDFVCVDEAQDYSALALEFTLRLVDPTKGGRLLFVGDPHQSIFGFAGADTHALTRIQETAGATRLPLSISYRCPRSHVELARLLSPEIESRIDAPAGRVIWIADKVLEHWARDGDMILCRSNAPLLRASLRLARAGRRAFVLGRDLVRQLATLAERAVPEGCHDVPSQLILFAVKEQARLRRQLAGKPHEQSQIDERMDLIDCLRTISLDLPVPSHRETSGHLESLMERIESMFSARAEAVMLSSVHRAKGKEADRVFILYPHLMPVPYARTEEAIRSEACVQFVALTRSRADLVFVAEPDVPFGPNEASVDSPWQEVLALSLELAGGRG